MIKSLSLSTALLSIGLLMSAGSVSARTRGTFVPNPGSDAQIAAVASAVNPAQILTLWASAIYTGVDDGDRNTYKDKGNDSHKDKDKDIDRDKDTHGPIPTPESPTILSFGAALLIGGGVLYSLRLRGSKK